MSQINEEQFSKILRYIQSGINSGATLVTGGDRIGNKGYYIQPTIFCDVQVWPIVLYRSLVNSQSAFVSC